ncbi:MAG: DEAD/DEAH box helicase [Kiritimatiellae bacterium]|nr:DEAD/DEAH box helicase [Kiritimatiellia bacterium]
MDVTAFLNEVRSADFYDGQLVYVREVPARPAGFAEPRAPLPAPVRHMLAARGIARLYTHQARTLDLLRAGKDALVVTGTASGKTLAYVLPIVETLLTDPDATFLLLFPTKALSQDQFKGFNAALQAAGLRKRVLAGVYDGDTPGPMRRKLRDQGAVILTNPDMLHAALMPQHARWARFLSRLRMLVLDELHVYSGIFGSNMANLLRRFFRVCAHHGAQPRIAACSATIGNPAELAAGLTGRPLALVAEDGSPRGKRTYVFWNPPRVRSTQWRSRRSANVEAHELMALLVQRGVPTITFSKAKMTAEMIHRYVGEKLRETAPHLAGKIAPYRGGYLPRERREIERRLFNGELLGVSTTRALELGIDVGGLDASILVGYPGTLASFFQQSGRAGREDRDALVMLVGLDTSVNQYVMSHPEYIFGRPVECGVLDSDNPFVLTGHLRCATHELPLRDTETGLFGAHAALVLRILEENMKVKHIDARWYHAAAETPQHDVSLRDRCGETVVIQDAGTGAVLGELDKLDAPPIVHPGAVYMHQGDTYRVLELDLDRNIARVERADVDYYTQPMGGTDVHHIDHQLREKPFGTGRACWGEVTAYFKTYMYEKVHFYSLDALSQHGVDLPTQVLETMAVWLLPPEELMERVRTRGLDAHSGLRGIGYATRMILPLFMTCNTLDFSHSVGSVNSPWNAVFIYEHYPLGLGFTDRVYERLHEIMPAVLDLVRRCGCQDGCPCCVGKPLRTYSTWNVERGEASIPSKAAARMILEGFLADGSNLRNADTASLTDAGAAACNRLEAAVRRRLERMREPQVFHPIEPAVRTQYPKIEAQEHLMEPDVSKRAERERRFTRELRRRVAKNLPSPGLDPDVGRPRPPPGMKKRGSNKPPTHFPGRPAKAVEKAPAPQSLSAAPSPVRLGDSLAARARRLKKKRDG